VGNKANYPQAAEAREGKAQVTKIINENIIKAVAEIAAKDIQRQYPGVDYLTSTVRLAVIDAANKVMDLDVRP